MEDIEAGELEAEIEQEAGDKRDVDIEQIGVTKAKTQGKAVFKINQK